MQPERADMRDHLKRYAGYIRNTGKRPLPIAMFDEDWEPVGPMVRRDMLADGLIEEFSGGLMLTAKADQALDHDYRTTRTGAEDGDVPELQFAASA